MFRAILIFTFFLCTSVNASKQAEIKYDFGKLMYGVWADSYTDEGRVLSYMTYLPEGRFHAYGYFEDDIRSYFFADGLWKMVGDQSCIVFEFDSFDIFEKDEASCVTVISVTNDSIVYRDNEDNSIHTLKRVSTGFVK